MHKDKQSTKAGFHFKVKGEGRGGTAELWIFRRHMGIWNKKHQSPGSGQSTEHVLVLLTNGIYNGQQLHSMFIKKNSLNQIICSLTTTIR